MLCCMKQFAYFCKNFAVSHFYSLQISNIADNTPSSITLTFAIPEELRDVFRFNAGQYITVRHFHNGEELRRAYSICSPPSELQSLSVGIKKVKDGVFSVYANTVLKVGDTLEVMPPEGRFVFTPGDAPRNIMAIAAGSGITPIMSIVQTVLDTNPENRMVLLYGNQSKEETMFYDSLTELRKKYPDRFFLQYSYTRQSETGALFGRIDAAKVNYMVKNKFSHLDFDSFYICGPEPMIHVAKECLITNQVSADQILFELFTEPEVKVELPADLNDNETMVKVILDDEEHSMKMARKDLVLDAVLKAKIDAPYSCQGGVCSTCIARVKEGSAVMEKNQILTDGEVAEGFILTCQSHPTSPTLVIDYDDV